VVAGDEALGLAARRPEDAGLRIVGAVGQELQRQKRMRRAALSQIDLNRVYVPRVPLVEDRDKPNAVLAMLWPHLPTTAGKTAKVTEMVNAGGLLPSDRGYWTYMGSLTRPPCTEGVRWFVFENEITLGREQLRAFTAIFKMNSRPLQGMHGRRIEANE